MGPVYFRNCSIDAGSLAVLYYREESFLMMFYNALKSCVMLLK